MNHLLDRLKVSFRAFKNYQKPFSLIYSEDLLSNAVSTALKKVFPNTEHYQLMIRSISESVTNQAAGLGKKTPFDIVSERDFDQLRNIKQNYCLIAGVAASWELELKFFASRIGVEVYRSENEGDHLEFKTVSLLVEKITAKYPQINCGFDEIRDIRNGLIHGNLQQLKENVLPMLTANQKAELDPKMAVISLQTNGESSIRMVGEPFSKAEAAEMGPFMWFLAGGNSKLLHHASGILSNSIAQVIGLTTLFSLCFDETKGFFEQLAQEGKPWSESQALLFAEKRKGFFIPGTDMRRVIQDYHSLFRLQ